MNVGIINGQDVDERNTLILSGKFDALKVFSRLERLEKARFPFKFDFGLDELPLEGGVIVVRGPRQYGKSTWLESQVVASVKQLGPGTTAYLNGDVLRDERALYSALVTLLHGLSPRAAHKRIFIDEITAIDDWQRPIKILADEGKLENVLIVTTGSRATDLRRASERLPGRKGRLPRTDYIFTPISFSEFTRVAGHAVRGKEVPAYLLAGGSPLALGELATTGTIPEWVITLTRDWVIGEFSRDRMQRSTLLAVFEQIFRHAQTAFGYTKLAREAGVANNTVARGYVEKLTDLYVVAPSFSWDPSKNVSIQRRPCKFQFINLLAAVSFSPHLLRTVDQFEALSPTQQAPWYEWLVAQELWRRRALASAEIPELLQFWNNKHHEIDFVLDRSHFVEVKRGKASPLEFAWFPSQFRNGKLVVVASNTFEAMNTTATTFEAFLRGETT